MSRPSARVQLPDPIEQATHPLVLNSLGHTLILSDCHIPFHDKPTIEAAVKEGVRRNVKHVILNGDILDQLRLSRFDHSPDDHTFLLEITQGRQFLSYLRGKFPKARIFYKLGNHENRLLTYLASKAPALFGLDVLEFPYLLNFREYGVEYVADSVVIQMMGLNVLHGHEFRGGSAISPARSLLLKTRADALCGHFHRTDTFSDKSLLGETVTAWATGCCCQLKPKWLPFNRWGHGFAFVEVSKKGHKVENIRVVDGEMV